ncbi:MAG: MFS transporter [Planctomycetes bacterium]|nr:MFS transporter [Planctomycetota bacterium]
MLEKLRRMPRALYFLFAGTTITRLGAFVFPYLTIYLSEARGYGVDRVGLILSVGSLGLLAGNFAGGWLTDRWRRKSTLVLALLLNAAGFAGLAGHYESGWTYAIFLFIGYVGSGMYTPAANTVVADLAPEDIRPFAYTVNYVCINLGMGLGPLIGGFLAAVSYNWIFIGDVATSLVCAGLIAVGVVETRPTATGNSARTGGRGRSYPSVWMQHPLVLIFCLSFFFLIGPLMGLEYAVPLLVKTVFLSSLTFVGVIYTINAACILSLSFVIERLIRGRNEYLMMIVSGLFWTAGLLILLLGFSLTALMICTAVWTIGEIIASILVPSFIAQRVAPDVKGRFMALNDIVRSFAGVVCPIGLGFIWANHGVVPVTAILAALPAVGVLCYVVMLLFTAQPNRAVAAEPVTVES